MVSQRVNVKLRTQVTESHNDFSAVFFITPQAPLVTQNPSVTACFCHCFPYQPIWFLKTGWHWSHLCMGHFHDQDFFHKQIRYFFVAFWDLCVFGILNTIFQLVKYLADSLKFLYSFPVMSSSCLACLYLYHAAWFYSNDLIDFSLGCWTGFFWCVEVPLDLRLSEKACLRSEASTLHFWC